MRTRDRVFELREIILHTAEIRGARDLRLFGSVARGDDTENSDVDFLVSLVPGRTLMDLARLEIDLERILGRRVDVVTERGLTDPIRSSVLTEAVRV